MVLYKILYLGFFFKKLIMGKDLKGKELGVGITQQKNGLYNAGFVDKLGIRRVKRFKKLQECRKWLDQARYTDEHSSITEANTMMVDAFLNTGFL
ncbi:hypothetical protein SAMN05216390_101476 [Lachnospiraceae bacterium KH1T2]|nr:hypothetical protein SAMN05216390_101476 [Lachnospiraceae bacterium KH1T2]